MFGSDSGFERHRVIELGGKGQTGLIIPTFIPPEGLT